jgi:GTP-binding protein
VVHARFVLSAASASDFPTTGFAEIALVGRSNVGKSSLINALVKKTIARTSAAPGKTRLANYYLIESPIPNPQFQQPFYLVDLPGYGYARGGAEAAREFERLTGAYFTLETGSPRRIAGVLHFIDARHPDLPQDLSAHRWIMNTAVPMAVIATKMDKLKQSDRAKTLRGLDATYRSRVLPESAPEHEGFDEIWKTLRAWVTVGT